MDIKANIVYITKNKHGEYDVLVKIHNGPTEAIEGLYDMDSAFGFGRMVLCYNDNKYR